MSRYRPSGSYGHSIKRLGPDWFRLHWTVDRYYPNSRLRFPRGASRDTDTNGAKRFAKRWGLPNIAEEQETPNDRDHPQA